MKKPLLISLSLLSVGLISGIYAQTTGATGSLVNKMSALAHSFTLSATLNPGETGLQSSPVKGKKTGDILTAGEWNRILELMSEGGAGGGGSGWEDVSLTDTADFDKACEYRYQALNSPDDPYMGNDPFKYIFAVDNNRLTGFAWGDYHHINSDSKTVYRINGAPLATITINKLQKRCGGGGSSNSAPAFYKCTNAQSLDTTNAPCYGASRNGGAGTNQYRVVSCSNTDASGTYTAGGLLNFGDFIANKWSFHINNSNIACTDGSVLVMDIQGGGSGGSAGWEDVPLTDTADFDDSCMYRYQITYSAGGREPYVPKETYYYANGMSKTQLVWWLENDSQNTTYHIAASSKNLLRINGTAYTTGGVSVTKIEKLCGGGGGSGGGMSAPSVISCKKKNSTYATSTLTGQPLVKFTASDCGGTLPDASYNGAIGSLNVCNGAIDHTVYSGGSVNGPGVSFSFRGGYACTWSDGSGYDISVVYMK